MSNEILRPTAGARFSVRLGAPFAEFGGSHEDSHGPVGDVVPRPGVHAGVGQEEKG